MSGSSRPSTASVTRDGWRPPPLLDAGPTSTDLLGALPHRASPIDVHCAVSSFADIPWVASRGNYPAMYALAQLVRPTSILEIGTLYGYGLCAWLRGAPNAWRAVALDAETYFGGGYLDQARANIEAVAPPDCRVDVRRWDTANGLPADLAETWFNLVIVDGDHSYAGKRRDLALAWSVLSGSGWLFVDDVHSMPAVQQAVADWVGGVDVAACLEVFTRTTDRPRGAYLLKKGPL